MTMPSSGALNMGGTSTPVSVAQELGLGLTATISMNQSNVRTLAAVGGSGTSWSMNALYGKSNTLTGPWVQKTDYSTQATGQYYINSLAYGNGRWALVGGLGPTYTPEVFTSDNDGVTWTRRLLPAGYALSRCIAYGNGTWVIVGAVTGGAHRFLYSTDNMATWNNVAVSTADLGDNFNPLNFGNGYFVTSNFRSVYRSTNGISWTQGTITASGSLAEFVTNNTGSWLTYQYPTNAIKYSTDNGANFSSATVGSGEIIYGCTYGNGKWVIVTVGNVGSTYTARIYNSTSPGSGWTLVNSYSGNSSSYVLAFYGTISFTRGTYATGTGYYGSWRSTDGINWTASAPIAAAGGNTIAASPTAIMNIGGVNTILLS